MLLRELSCNIQTLRSQRCHGNPHFKINKLYSYQWTNHKGVTKNKITDTLMWNILFWLWPIPGTCVADGTHQTSMCSPLTLSTWSTMAPRLVPQHRTNQYPVSVPDLQIWRIQSRPSYVENSVRIFHLSDMLHNLNNLIILHFIIPIK